MNFVDFVQFGWLESCENFAFWFFDFVQSPPWQACNSKIRHFLVEGFLLLYETFRSLFFVSFKNFDFRNEIMLRTPGVCVCGASKLSLSIIDFFPYNICCWWIIYYQLKIFNSNTFYYYYYFDHRNSRNWTTESQKEPCRWLCYCFCGCHLLWTDKFVEFQTLLTRPNHLIWIQDSEKSYCCWENFWAAFIQEFLARQSS